MTRRIAVLLMLLFSSFLLYTSLYALEDPPADAQEEGAPIISSDAAAQGGASGAAEPDELEMADASKPGMVSPNATGDMQMTIVDQNGNLKMVPAKPNGQSGQAGSPPPAAGAHSHTMQPPVPPATDSSIATMRAPSTSNKPVPPAGNNSSMAAVPAPPAGDSGVAAKPVPSP
jgi:hypothetical protein